MPCSTNQDVLPPFSPFVAVVAAVVVVAVGMVGVVAAGVEESPSLVVFSDLSLLWYLKGGSVDYVQLHCTMSLRHIQMW